MIGVVMAGGFAKRLWPLTKDRPKPLLQVSGKPIIQYVLEKIQDIDLIYITTNEKFKDNFRGFLKGFKTEKKIKLVTEPSTGEEEKLGSIAGLNFLIKKEGIKDDLFVIAGDNLFKGFDIPGFLDFYKSKKATIVGLYDIKKIQAKKYGIVEIDKNNKIIGFEEKPEKPKSTLTSTGIYIYPKEILKLISKYLKGGNNPDAPGYFLAWLHKKVPVYGFVFKGKWFDIGSFESYEEAKREF